MSKKKEFPKEGNFTIMMFYYYKECSNCGAAPDRGPEGKKCWRCKAAREIDESKKPYEIRAYSPEDE